MQNKIVFRILIAVVFISLFAGGICANDIDSLFGQVEKLDIERHGYVLGKKLNRKQMKIAATHSLEATAEDTFKFKDKNLFVVAQKTTGRILVMYEQFDDANQKKVQDMIGGLYMDFDDPTVLAHDKVVYWAYDTKGKITSQAFDIARKDKKKLNILATIKCVSDIKIMEKIEDAAKGQVYYIISSEPILKFFNHPKT